MEDYRDNISHLTSSEATMELVLLESAAQDSDWVDISTRLTNAGLPQEIVTRLQDLWGMTKELSGKVVQVGRIVVSEIIRFIDANPNLAIGAALGVSVALLLGTVLAPYLFPIAVVLGLIGAHVGRGMDENLDPSSALIQFTQDSISLARKFFELLIAIFTSLRVSFTQGAETTG